MPPAQAQTGRRGIRDEVCSGRLHGHEGCLGEVGEDAYLALSAKYTAWHEHSTGRGGNS